jgi:hypothetical protein
MYQNSINNRYVRLSITPVNNGNATIQVVSSPDANFSLSAVKRDWKSLIGGTFLCMIVAAILTVVFINAMFFPDCNRDTRDCFLVEKLWGAK